MKRILMLMIVSASILFGSNSVSAQMFSVGNSPQQRSFPSSYFRIGMGPTNFEYKGNDINPLGSTLLEFDNNALFINMETPGTNLTLMLGNNITGLKDKSFFDLGFVLSNKFSIIRDQAFTIGIPIQLYSSITSINNDRAEENFNQVNFALGSGGFVNLKLGKKFTFTNELTPGYGFSNSSGGFFGGSLFFLTGKSRLNLINLIGGKSISIGYDYNYRSFDIDGELYDFDLKSHLLTIGFSL
tara:strand:- start:59701 stop:60426 length:726 start_codon:yes stop_codon:yes gene_type:complete